MTKYISSQDGLHVVGFVMERIFSVLSISTVFGGFGVRCIWYLQGFADS